MALHQAGQWQRLEAEARRMTTRCPAHPSGWTFLGLALQSMGKLPEAVAAFTHAARLVPQDAGAHGNLGSALKALGRHAEAESSYRKALELRPNHAVLHFNLGNLQRDSGHLAEAEASYRRALEIQPSYVAAQANLGSVFQDLGRLAEAETTFRRVLELDPDSAKVHNNLGNALKCLWRFSEAEACYRRALAIDPDSAEAHCNLGGLFWNRKRLAEAEASYRRSLEIRPDFAEAHRGLGSVLLERGRLADAETCYRKALALQPDYAGAQSSLLFSLTYQARPPALYIEEARKYGQVVSAKVAERFSAWSCTDQPERLRVGLVSGDLRRHPVGYFLESVLTCLDPARIELIAYPTVAKNDDLTDRLRPCFAEWRPLSVINDETAARQIHADGVHVLIDLSGHTTHNRLPVFSRRPAPVQATWLGYSASTGLAEMDWLIADPHVAPSGDEWQFTENVWRLPETYLCFTPPEVDAEVGPLPALSSGVVTFGSFNNLNKMSDAAVALWARVLQSVPGSRLLLKTEQLDDSCARDKTVRRFEACGIGAGRLLLQGHVPGRAEHLAAYGQVDIALDPFPYTGTTTCAEGLWMGVPFITRHGHSLISRVGESIARNAGLSDWIAADDDEYVAKAVAFASDLDRLAGLRAGLREQARASPLFDAPRFARHFEDALWGMWQQGEQHNNANKFD